MRLLLVEDAIQLSEALNQILSKNKYIVYVFYDGEDSLDYGLTDIYGVIILDIMLPKLNGLEILKGLRKKNIKSLILLLKAKGEIEDKVKGLDSGADDYLAKPFATDWDSQSIIDEIIDSKKSLSRIKVN